MGPRSSQPSHPERVIESALEAVICESRQQLEADEAALARAEEEVARLLKVVAERRRQLAEHEEFASKVKDQVRTQAAGHVTAPRLPGPVLTVVEGGQESQDGEGPDTPVTEPAPQLSAVQEAIIKVFERDPVLEWTPKAMAEETGLAYGTVRTTMTRMAESGLLKKVGYGRYEMRRRPETA